jgi:tripartite ATP-independent transporter DctP family solute receptor
MRKIPEALLAGLVLWTALTNSVQAADVKDRNFRIAVTQQQDNPYVMAAQKVADLISEKSGGKMKAKVFAGGALGGDAAVLSSMQGGTIDMTMSSSGLLYGMVKDFGLLSLPMLFNDAKEAYAILDGPVGKKLLDQLPAKGLIGLGYWEYGYKSVTNNRRPIEKIEDLQGLKLRVMQIPPHIDAFNALGSNAVPMAFPEVYGALETRAIDGQENTLYTIQSQKFDEVQKYLATTRHAYDAIPVLFSKKAWDRLSNDERKIIQDAVTEATPYQRQVSREKEAQALAAIKQKGMVVTELSPQERDRLREKVKTVWAKYEKEADPALVKELHAEIAKARAQK